MNRDDLFNVNAGIAKGVVEACAKFCPDAAGRSAILKVYIQHIITCIMCNYYIYIHYMLYTVSYHNVLSYVFYVLDIVLYAICYIVYAT